jgi:hypothetical protein
MGRINKVYFGILALASLFVFWGFYRWWQARSYTPSAPVAAAVNRYFFEKATAVFPTYRYAKLRTGELFFGPGPGQESPKPVFSSKLLLYGVSKGANARINRAVVGLVADPNKQTWMVQVGSVVAGETVVKIEEKGIWVKNGTGKGKVELRRE